MVFLAVIGLNGSGGVQLSKKHQRKTYRLSFIYCSAGQQTSFNIHVYTAPQRAWLITTN